MLTTCNLFNFSRLKPIKSIFNYLTFPFKSNPTKTSSKYKRIFIKSPINEHKHEIENYKRRKICKQFKFRLINIDIQKAFIVVFNLEIPRIQILDTPTRHSIDIIQRTFSRKVKVFLSASKRHNTKQFFAFVNFNFLLLCTYYKNNLYAK